MSAARLVLLAVLALALGLPPFAAAAYDPYFNAVMPDDPVGYWSLGEPSGTTAGDASGNVYQGTYQNGVRLGVPGAIPAGDEAARFDGYDDRVDMGDRLDFSGRSPFSVVVWVKPASVPSSSWPRIVTKELVSSAGRDGWDLILNSGCGFIFERWITGPGSGNQAACSGANTVVPGRWYHVVGTYDGTYLRIYVDGVLRGTRFDDRWLADTTASLALGRNTGDGTSNVFAGDLDEVTIYPRALTREQIWRQYGLAAWRRGYREEVLADKPRAFWRLGETPGQSAAADASGNGQSGSYYGGATVGVAGAVADPDLATAFDGTDDYVFIPDSPALAVTGSVTVEAWVKTPGFTRAWQAIAGKGDTSYHLQRYSTSRSAMFAVAYNGTWYSAIGSAVIDDGAWHHVVGVYDQPSQTLRLYVDGKQDGYVARGPAGVNATTYPFGIGENTQARGRYWSGSIDEVAVYPSALTAERVRIHHLTGRSYMHPVKGDVPTAYWRLGEPRGQTSTAADATGNRRHGTYRGTTPGAPGALETDANTAATFDGVDDDVLVGDLSALDFGTGDFTAEAWILTEKNGEETIVGKHDGTAPHWFITVSDDTGYVGRIRARINDGAVSRTAYGPQIRVDDGVWHHVVVIFDRDWGIRVLVDGLERATQGAMTSNVSNAAPFRIGWTTHYQPFSGTIDEVALYAHTLSAQQARRHNEAGTELPIPYDGGISPEVGTGYWRLGEVAGSTRAVNDGETTIAGTYHGGVRLGATGALLEDPDTAPIFDGVDDYVSVADAAALDITGSLTLEAWVKTDGAFTRTWQHIAGKGDSAYVLQRNGDTRGAAFTVQSAGTWYGARGTTPIDDGQWHHLVGIYDQAAQTVTLYVDGTEDGRVAGPASLGTNDYAFGIGENTQATGRYWKGSIDDVALYPHALPGAHVAVNFEAGSAPDVYPNFGSTPGVVRTVNGQYEWRLTNELGGKPEHVFTFQCCGTPIVGDWNGDGTKTPGVVYGGNHWVLSNDYSGTVAHDFYFGLAGDTPLAGDWNGDGADTPAVRRDNAWHFNDGFDGAAERTLHYGYATDDPLVGDWNGDGVDTPGVRRTHYWYLTNDFDPIGEIYFGLGNDSGDLPVVGDWNADGIDTVGVRRANEYWWLVDSHDSDVDYLVDFGNDTGGVPISGTWGQDADGATDGIEEAGVGAFSAASLDEASVTASESPGPRTYRVPPVVKKYAPVVYLHPDEEYFPASPRTWFIKRSALMWSNYHIITRAGPPPPSFHRREGKVQPWRLGRRVRKHRQYWRYEWVDGKRTQYFAGANCTRPHEESEVCSSNRKNLDKLAGFFLDMNDSETARRGAVRHLAEEPVPVFYHYVEGRFITYWFFYPYNDSPGDPIDHEGDWERISVKLEGTQAVRIRLYRHNCDAEEPWWKVDYFEGHPKIFAALGSHGSYLAGGEIAHCKYGDIGVSDETRWPENNPGRWWKTWNNLHDVKKQTWFGFGGAWGSVAQESTHTSGPLGPGWKKPAPW